jgi:hypothetical protein
METSLTSFQDKKTRAQYSKIIVTFLTGIAYYELEESQLLFCLFFSFAIVVESLDQISYNANEQNLNGSCFIPELLMLFVESGNSFTCLIFFLSFSFFGGSVPT